MIPATNQPVFRVKLDSALYGPRLVRHEPLGLDGVGVSLHRDPKAHGVATEHTGSLSYVKDGKAYVLKAFEAAGIEADVSSLIEQYDPNNFRWEPYYAGRLNYLGAEFTATQAKVNLEQSSFLQKFLARDSVQVDVFGSTSVSGAASPAPAPQVVHLHSRALLQRYAASQKAETTVTAPMFGGDSDPSHEQLLYFGFDTAEVNELGLGAVTGGFVTGDAGSAVPIHRAKGPESLDIDLALFAGVEAHTGTGVPFMRQFTKVGGQVFLRVTGQNGLETLLQPEIAAGNLRGDYAGRISVAPRRLHVELQEGDAVYLFADWFVHDLDGGQFDPYQATITAVFEPGSYLRLTATNTTAATPTTGVLLYEGLERLTQALTDEVDVFRSDFFGRTDCALPYPVDGPGSLTLLTGGFQVRGFPPLSAPAPVAPATDLRKTLTTSWSEAFTSLQATYNIGYGVEWAVGRRGQAQQVVRVEHFSHFYPADVVLDLTGIGPVPLATHVSADYFYQVAEVGYAQWQAQTAGGLDEFNSRRQFTTPLTKVATTYSQVSKLSASSVLLEATRRDRFDVTATTDTSTDATNFLVCLLRTGTGFETERNQLAARLEGVLSPDSVYNLRLSPARLLRRHGPALRAGLKATTTAAVRFASGEGNTTMVSQFVDEPAAIAENGDVQVRDLPAPLWLPLEYVGQGVPVSRLQLQALLRRPTGRVRVLDEKGVVREGWVLDFKHAATAQTADFTLLACAS